MDKLQRLLQNKILILTICAAGIGGTFQYGYNISIINAPASYIQVFMNTTWLERMGVPLESNTVLLLWSFTVSAYPLGGLTGAVAAGPMAIMLGRELLGGEESWPFLLASNVVPALIQLTALPWFPESPRYLLIDRGDKESCISALQKLRGTSDLSAELEEMLAEQAAVKGQRAKNPWELFQNPGQRWQLVSIVVLSSAMQLCGNDSMYFYAAYVFQEAGIPEDKIPYVVIGTGSCELITSVTCNMIIDYAGRRPLLLGGYIFMAAWAIVFMVALSQQTQISWMPYLSMACIFAYILSFGIGPAGVTGVLPTEVFDQMSRPAAYMICGSLLWFNLFVVGTAFPFIVKSLAHFCYIPFLVVCVCTALYVWFFLPETKGKSFLEISEEFGKRNFKAKSRGGFYKGPEEIKTTSL
ncbi:solute carrier family 2, facilitated glucose transporter member 11-like isoform X2 [Melospiza georgiana]|uniref:solute carrier family 2, facilitated glucose transporter member 11-like isoform X2 n=1 Tax=Melospiza georgiana TaxID=44398 RepID=UPI0025AD994F|nr:solute carrier family 2, facilitated glucose transporter member 11-like isoform X2 [Melospiza georgiana]